MIELFDEFEMLEIFRSKNLSLIINFCCHLPSWRHCCCRPRDVVVDSLQHHC